jgi:hypothetical protein
MLWFFWFTCFRSHPQVESKSWIRPFAAGYAKKRQFALMLALCFSEKSRSFAMAKANFDFALDSSDRGISSSVRARSETWKSDLPLNTTVTLFPLKFSGSRTKTVLDPFRH